MYNFEERIVTFCKLKKPDKKLKNGAKFWKRMIQLKNGENMPDMEIPWINKRERKKLYSYGIECGEAAYHLGYMDGAKDANASEFALKSLPPKDLISLIKIYDSVKAIDPTMIDDIGMDYNDLVMKGILQKMVDVICDIVYTNSCSAAKTDVMNDVIFILCMNKVKAEKRAKMLLKIN